MSLPDYFDVLSKPTSPQVMEDYQAVFFRSEQGRRVLGHILTKLGHFHRGETLEDLHLQNHAKWLLATLGVWSRENLDSILNQYQRSTDA